MKICIVTTASSAFVNFRIELCHYLMNRGFDVLAVCGDDQRKADIEKEGIRFFCVPFDNRSLSLGGMRRFKKGMTTLLKEENPDILLTTQAKPNILGSMAGRASKLDIPIVSMIEGAGDPFQPRNLKGKVFLFLYKILYRKGIKKNDLNIFLNQDDFNLFCGSGISKKEKSMIIHGIGIDSSKFPYIEPPYQKKVLMIARLLINKGVWDYCKIAEIAKKMDPSIEFQLLGQEAEITKKDLEPYIDKGIINYLGETKDVRPFLAACDLSSSSSYREGFPRSILEAMSTGRAIVTTDSVGCRETIIPELDYGYSLSLKDLDKFARTIVDIVNDKERVKQMGLNARKAVETYFESDIINEILYKEFTRLLKKRGKMLFDGQLASDD